MKLQILSPKKLLNGKCLAMINYIHVLTFSGEISNLFMCIAICQIESKQKN